MDTRTVLTFLGWILSSFFLLIGCSALFTPNISGAISCIVWGLMFLPPSYSNMIKRYELDRNYNWNKDLYRRIFFLLISLIIASSIVPNSQKASKPQATSTQIVVQTPKAEAPKPIFVSSEYKMFRSAGASPEKAQALKDACTADKTCPTTLKIAKAIVRGEITLGLVSKPDQPCTETEFKKDDADFCYYKSAEGRKSISETETAETNVEPVETNVEPVVAGSIDNGWDRSIARRLKSGTKKEIIYGCAHAIQNNLIKDPELKGICQGVLIDASNHQ
jgi:hypothetical protein